MNTPFKVLISLLILIALTSLVVAFSTPTVAQSNRPAYWRFTKDANIQVDVVADNNVLYGKLFRLIDWQTGTVTYIYERGGNSSTSTTQLMHR